ncbi:uncharacterized protein Nse4 [Epargyreus clarus]|uniref:uncharacterized protein Nse4 n=1 Tax=Epargyreus clarus TaxID=520877 RepID=UPI003C2D5284
MSQSSTPNESATPQQNMMLYRKLRIDLQALSSNLADNDKRIEEMERVLNMAKEITKTSTNRSVGERHFDSCLILKVGEQVVQCAQDMVINSNVYSWSELADHISDKPSYWEFGLPLAVRPGAFLLGALAAAPAPRAAPRPRQPQRQRRRPGVAQRPQNLQRMELPQEDLAIVKSIHKFIKKRSERGPLSYLHCVLDPASFCRTVENIYHVSFLARDGKVAVDIDNNHGIPMLRAVEGGRADQPGGDNNQFVMSIDMARWKSLVQACGIREAMMKFQQDSSGRVTLQNV